jgi:hypothetical protein
VPQTKRHKVFISYYDDDDQEWKDRFVGLTESRLIDWWVNLGDTSDHRPPTADTMRRISDEPISWATVMVVLIVHTLGNTKV